MSRWPVAVEAGRARDGVGMLAEPDTAVGEAGFEGVDVGKSLVSSDLPQQRPADRPGRCRFVQDEMLSGVELRCIGRQKDEPKVAGNVELR